MESKLWSKAQSECCENCDETYNEGKITSYDFSVSIIVTNIKDIKPSTSLSVYDPCSIIVYIQSMSL